MNTQAATDRTPKSAPGDMHVLPSFGKPHHESSACWCKPHADPVTLDRKKYTNTAWVHEVEQ